MQPIWGLELLASVACPWDLKPIIRWHHERYDGTGYPDRLRGDEIPLAAQIVGIVDVYDALTTARAYRPALPPAAALAEISAHRGWWSKRVFEAFFSVTQAGHLEGDADRPGRHGTRAPGTLQLEATSRGGGRPGPGR